MSKIMHKECNKNDSHSTLASRRKRIAIFLYVACVVMMFGVIFSDVFGICAFVRLTGAEQSSQYYLSLVMLCVNFCVDIAIPIVLIRIVYSVCNKSIFFSKCQSIRMMLIGFLLLARVVLELFNPSFNVPYGEDLDIFVVSAPSFDLLSLTFAFVFFALAGIFEYGRILQEENDGFL